MTSIFLGGGTPSLIPTRFLKQILDAVVEDFKFSENIEITCEANPETIHEDWVQFIRNETPINRVSMGVQSRDPQILETLERKVNPDAIERALSLLTHNTSYDLSVDLIFGIPDQSIAKYEADVLWARNSGLNHLSSYQLTLKPGHNLYSQLPNEEQSCQWYEHVWNVTEKVGYASYEISNFSVPGYECSHNLIYWRGGDFFGVGPSAASRYFSQGVFHHRKQISDLKKYIEFPHALSNLVFEKNSRESSALEALMLEIRTSQGIDLAEFEKRYGLKIEHSSKFASHLSSGTIEMKGKKLRLTKSGKLLCDSIALDLSLVPRQS